MCLSEGRGLESQTELGGLTGTRIWNALEEDKYSKNGMHVVLIQFEMIQHFHLPAIFNTDVKRHSCIVEIEDVLSFIKRCIVMNELQADEYQISLFVNN